MTTTLDKSATLGFKFSTEPVSEIGLVGIKSKLLNASRKPTLTNTKTQINEHNLQQHKVVQFRLIRRLHQPFELFDRD